MSDINTQVFDESTDAHVYITSDLPDHQAIERAIDILENERGSE